MSRSGRDSETKSKEGGGATKNTTKAGPPIQKIRLFRPPATDQAFSLRHATKSVVSSRYVRTAECAPSFATTGSHGRSD